MVLTSLTYSINLLQAYQAGEPMRADAFRTDWLFALLVLPFFLYMLVLLFERFPGLRIARIITSNNFANTAFREAGTRSRASQVLLGILSLITISGFLYFIELHYKVYLFGLHGFRLWVLNLVVFSSSVFLRFLVCTITGKISRAGEVFREYFFNISQFYKFLSLILLILNFFISYLVFVPDNVLIIIGIAAAIILLILRIFRLFSIFIRRSFSLYYLILYLCALEFTPVLIFIKYLSGLI